MFYKYTLLFAFLLLSSLALQAQNCPTSVAGQLVNSNTPILVSDTTPVPVYTVTPTGLPNIEFLVVRQDTLAADGFGPPILVSSLTGQVVPADLGLTTCQELCLVPFSYNLSQIQLVADSLLNGMYLAGATCCSAAGNFFPGLCDSLNAQGIFNGSDIQNLNDVINFTNAIAGTAGTGTSVPNLVSTINQLNNFIGLFGNCAANIAEICYAVNTADSAHTCYQVVLPNAATLILASPDSVVVGTDTSYQCMASYLPNSSLENIVWSLGMPNLGCTIDSMGVLQTDSTSGTIWVYATGTRGCQSDSILIEIDASLGLALLLENKLELQVAPLPFDQQMVIALEVEAGEYQLQLVDALGRVVYTAQQALETGVQQWVVPTADLPVGAYILYIQGEQEQGSLKVVKQ